MDSLLLLIILVALFHVSESQVVDGQPAADPIPPVLNKTEMQDAVSYMRAKSYNGSAILLQMVNGLAQLNRPLTFLMPVDSKLSESAISLSEVEEFITSHVILMPLTFNDILHFPTSTLVPIGFSNKTIRITNHGRDSFFVNNAHIVTQTSAMALPSGVTELMQSLSLAMFQLPQNSPECVPVLDKFDSGCNKWMYNISDKTGFIIQVLQVQHVQALTSNFNSITLFPYDNGLSAFYL